MVFERTEHEPEEYDPEAELRDPESDSLTIPEVTTAETDVPPEVLKAFWVVVLLVNGAVLALSLGALVLVFEGDVTRGGALLAVGIMLFGSATYRYRRYRRDAPEDTDETAVDPDDERVDN